jgi:Ca2+-binding EF-hand superfamily protein
VGIFYFCDKLRNVDTEEMVAELFDVFDINNDGVISKGEFIALAESLLHHHGMNFSSDIFKQFDANHDNVISRDELIEMVIDLAL